LPADGWSLLQHMLPEIGDSFHSAPCGCMIKFGDAMSIFGSDAAKPTDNPHKLLKLCKDFTLQSQKQHERSELEIPDDCVESVLVYVAALGGSVLQARIDALPAAAVELERTAADGLSTRATLEEDRNFIARDTELHKIELLVEAVFTSNAPAARSVLLLRGHPGLGKSAAAKQGLRRMQNKYAAASCCKGVHVPSIIRGRGAAAVDDDILRWGRDLGSTIGVGPGAPPETVLPLLKAFLTTVRYVVLIDDADKAGIQQALKHLPPSGLRCTLLVTSQILQEKDLRAYLTAAESGVSVRSSVEVSELQSFTSDECMQLMRSLCPPPPYKPFDKPPYSYAPMYAYGADLCAVFEALVWLPLAVRFFGSWLGGRYRDEMKAKQKAAGASTAFDEAATGATVVQSLLAEWRTASAGVVLAAGAEHSRGLQGTVKLALHVLNCTPHAKTCTQLLAMLALCPPVKTPWSLFDGGGTELAALMTRGRRVVVKGRPMTFLSIHGELCRFPKCLASLEGCRVVVTNLVSRQDVNGLSGVVYGPYDDDKQRWPVRVTLPSGLVQEIALRACNVICALEVGCLVYISGLGSRPELNGNFGRVLAFDTTTQRWRINVFLPSGTTQELALRETNLTCFVDAVVLKPSVDERQVVVQLLDNGKTAHIPVADLQFEGSLKPIRQNGQWSFNIDAASSSCHQEGRIFRQHEDGSVSVIFQGPHQGCHVQLQGLLSRADLNGCFGYVCGACDGATQRWTVKVTLPTGDTKDMSLKADNLVCTRQVMVRDGNGGLCAVPAFASGWLTKQRPGAEVLRFRREDVECARPEGVLADVTDGLSVVAAAVGSSGLVDVDEVGRTFGMHQLLQQAVRAELGDAHDGSLAALLEARCGHMSDENYNNQLLYGVMQEVVVAAAHVVSQLKAAAPSRSRWACCMRLRMAELVCLLLTPQSLAIRAFFDIIDEDFCALGIVEGRPAAAEFRAMSWMRGLLHGSLESLQALVIETEAAVASAFNASDEWDCRMALAQAQHSFGIQLFQTGQFESAIRINEFALRNRMHTLGEMHHHTAKIIYNTGNAYSKMGQWDRSIENFERALHIEIATLGEMHPVTAQTIVSIASAYGEKGQVDRAIKLTEQALRIQTATLGECHAETASSMVSLATSIGFKKQFDRAIPLFERALSIIEVTVGDMDSRTVGAINGLGLIYYQKGQCDRAIELYERALRLRISAGEEKGLTSEEWLQFADMHFDTAVVMCNLAVAYSSKGQFDRAIAEAERALCIVRQVRDPFHPQRQQMEQNLAVVKLNAGQKKTGRGRR